MRCSKPRVAARLAIADAHGVYVARTYAYVAAGREGLAIVDVERPEMPLLDRMWNAGGELKDTRDVKIASTNASLFAYFPHHAGGHVLGGIQFTAQAIVFPQVQIARSGVAVYH